MYSLSFDITPRIQSLRSTAAASGRGGDGSILNEREKRKWKLIVYSG